MMSILDAKGAQVTLKLLECLNGKNSKNLEIALNANTILLEMC